jgi:addiction module HigA family antidote
MWWITAKQTFAAWPTNGSSEVQAAQAFLGFICAQTSKGLLRKEGPMEMFNPPHPGEIVREDYMKALGLTVTAAAQGLGVTRKTLSELLNGHSGISPEMAIRLEMAGWSAADHWLRMQVQHDLWHARQHAAKIKVKRFPQPEPTPA